MTIVQESKTDQAIALGYSFTPWINVIRCSAFVAAFASCDRRRRSGTAAERPWKRSSLDCGMWMFDSWGESGVPADLSPSVNCSCVPPVGLILTNSRNSEGCPLSESILACDAPFAIWLLLELLMAMNGTMSARFTPPLPKNAVLEDRTPSSHDSQNVVVNSKWRRLGGCRADL